MLFLTSEEKFMLFTYFYNLNEYNECNEYNEYYKLRLNQYNN
jgi:hypothetical protein